MSGLADLQALDVLERLAGQDSPLHRRHAQVKLLAAGLFLAGLISLPSTDIAALPPFALLWLLAAALGGLPPRRLLLPALAALPFALLLGAWNPVLDRRPVLFGSMVVAEGWITLAQLMGKAVLATATATLLAACTDFPDLCAALEGLGAPKAFTQQLLFLRRYLSVLAEEAACLRRARDLRSPAGSPGRGPRVAAGLIAVLLRKSLDRAQRIHAAMLCRLYQGGTRRFPTGAWNWGDGLFLAAAAAGCAACRFLPLTETLGTWMQGGRP